MKKTICTSLICALALSSTALAAGRTLSVGGEKYDIAGSYTSGKTLMLPVRSVAEKLGFTVTWDAESNSARLDNGEVYTLLGVGDTSYFSASSTAIGMTAPISLGAAVELKDSVMYAPAGIYTVLYHSEDAVKIDGYTVTITPEGDNNAQIPNPFTEYKTLADAKAALSFAARVPASLPDGFSLSHISTLSDNFLQVIFTDGKRDINYRVSTDSDISGDYNTYKTEKTVTVGDFEVKMRGNARVSGATWSDGKLSYSLLCTPANYNSGVDAELSETEFISIIKSVTDVK